MIDVLRHGKQRLQNGFSYLSVKSDGYFKTNMHAGTQVRGKAGKKKQ